MRAARRSGIDPGRGLWSCTTDRIISGHRRHISEVSPHFAWKKHGFLEPKKSMFLQRKIFKIFQTDFVSPLATHRHGARAPVFAHQQWRHDHGTARRHFLSIYRARIRRNWAQMWMPVVAPVGASQLASNWRSHWRPLRAPDLEIHSLAERENSMRPAPIGPTRDP